MGTFERKFTLQVPSATVNLALIREFVSGIGARAGLGAAQIGKLELAVDEACANVIEHAYQHDATKEVMVRVTFDEQILRITVEDTGREFDPGSVVRQDLKQLVEKRKSGGLGVGLIQTLMDEVRYERVPGQKNALHMAMRIQKPIASE